MKEAIVPDDLKAVKEYVEKQGVSLVPVLEDGDTYIHYAAKCGSDKVLEYLLPILGDVRQNYRGEYARDLPNLSVCVFDLLLAWRSRQIAALETFKRAVSKASPREPLYLFRRSPHLARRLYSFVI